MKAYYRITRQSDMDELARDIRELQKRLCIADLNFSVGDRTGTFMWECPSRGIVIMATPGWEGSLGVPVEISSSDGTHLESFGDVPIVETESGTITLVEYLAIVHAAYAYIRSDHHPASGKGPRFPVKSPAPDGKTIPSAGGAPVEQQKKQNGPIEFYHDVLKWDIHNIRVDADTDADSAIKLLVYQFVQRSKFESMISSLQDVTPRAWAFQVGRAALQMMDDLEGTLGAIEMNLHEGDFAEKK